MTAQILTAQLLLREKLLGLAMPPCCERKQQTQLLLREKLLGLAMPPCCERKQQEAVKDDHRGGELSEEEVWEVASSASKLEDGKQAAAKMESFAVQLVSRLSNDHVEEAMESSKGMSSLSLVIDIPRARSTNPNCVKLRRYGASAPMKVPERPKASARNRASFIIREEMEGEDAGGYDHEYNHSNTGERLPPHLIMARQNSMVASSSVMEGAGRTLKGRDLRNVRNAVWKCTGFI